MKLTYFIKNFEEVWVDIQLFFDYLLFDIKLLKNLLKKLEIKLYFSDVQLFLLYKLSWVRIDRLKDSLHQ